MSDFPESVSDFLIAANGSVRITGPTGVGKTRCASAWLANEVAALAVDGRFVRAAELLALMRRMCRPAGDPEAEERLTRIQTAEFVVLDDLGGERVTEWAEEQLLLFVDERYTRRRRLLITSNLGLAELGDRLGARTASRLAEMTLELRLKGPDRRVVNSARALENVLAATAGTPTVAGILLGSGTG